MFWNLMIAGLAIGPVLSGVVKNQIQSCSSSEFACPDGSCVGSDRVCDGVSDCADRSDEAACLPGANSALVLGDVFRRGKRQSSCRRDQWRCRDGTCIPFYGKCDGLVDCPDGSDETHPLCRNQRCQDYLFRCTYGACVDGTAPCNGVQDCNDNSDELLPKCRNETRIVKGQFKCDNGQQISVTELCDGDVNCEDGSDEKIETCAGKTCLSYLFQCAYGACVDAGSDCNGKQECADGSDESDELCNRTTTGVVTPSTLTTTTATVPSSGGCVLPEYPANGRYEVRGRPSARPGLSFDGVVSVSVACDPGYAVNGNDSQLILCYPEADLEDVIPRCERYCELPPHPSVMYECEKKNAGATSRWPCGAREFVGTTVVPTCRTPNYHGSPAYMHCTENGWNYIARCAPECGRTTPMGQEYIIDGRRAKHGEIPWHAGIYAKTSSSYKQICGGSLVSTKVIISAAHCFWKDGKGKQPPEHYAVALGKIFRPWNDSHDEEAQFSNVTEIHIPDHFKGSQTNFQKDIAVVILEKEIEYKTFIRPVCISFDPLLNSRQLQAGKLGKIAGWGLTSANGKSAQVLQVVELPFVPFDICYDEAPEDFREYITGDKICAGFRNGTALCQGDSGGGLAFPDYVLGVQRYYLRGIVSTAPRNNQLCDPFQRTTFTEIISHEHYIKNLYLEGL